MAHGIDFDTLYTTYFSRIHGYLVRLIGTYHAEDAAQEVFKKAGEHLDTLKDESRISTWLYRIATNTAIDKTRSPAFRDMDRKNDLNQEGLVPDRNIWTGKEKPPVDQKLIKEEMRSCVQEFIARLPEDYRTILILKDYENKTDREISQIMDITLSTAKIRYHRAKKLLKKELDSGCDFFYDDENRLQCDRKQSPGIFEKPPE